MNDSEKQQKLAELNYVFTPSAPIIINDLFFGRIDQLKKVVGAIQEVGQHAVLYGERGVGKTSLANVLNDRLKGILITKVTCNRTENFRAIWEKTFKKIKFVAKSSGFGFTAEEVEKVMQLDLFLPQKDDIDSTDILNVLEVLQTPILLIFDEFDSIRDKATQIKFADTIKALSDNAQKVTVLVVGIAESVNDLIGLHPSNERCIKQIKIPRMSADELAEIIDNGLKKLGMTIDPFVRLDILEFSYGFPHYTHLLTKYIAKTALQNNSIHISREHFDVALDEALDNVSESIRNSYQQAIITTKTHSMFSDILLACALAKEDEHGTFRITDLEDALQKITGKYYKVQSFSYHIGKLCDEERGAILEEVLSGKNRRYRFANPLFRAFVRIKLYQSGKLNKSETA